MKLFHSMALVLACSGAFAQNRPQTPVPPYPYISEEVSYTGAEAQITYGATITIPDGGGRYPAILLVTGSGPQNRDEEIMGHKPFAVLADELTRNGYVVLRVDDRGTGKTTGSFSEATTEDFVRDALSSLAYLRSRKEVNTQKVGVCGHSEGGLIAEILAAKEKDIAFVILMAAPGMSTEQVMLLQNEALLKQAGMADSVREDYLKLYGSLARAVAVSTGKDELRTLISREIDTWIKQTPASTVLLTTGITNEETKARVVEQLINTFGAPWLMQFFRYDAGKYLEQIQCKVLAINGSRDVQIVSGPNLEGIRKGLEKAKNKQYTVKELEGLNHLFQQCRQCDVQEYGKLEETIAPLALKTITDWLKAEVN